MIRTPHRALPLRAVATLAAGAVAASVFLSVQAASPEPAPAAIPAPLPARIATAVDGTARVLSPSRAPRARTTRPRVPAAHVSREIIIKIDKGTAGARKQAALADYGAPLRHLPAADAHVLTVPVGADAATVAREAAGDPRVDYAMPNRQYLPAANDPHFARQWGMDSPATDIDIDMPEAALRVPGKSSVVVGVMDSGIDIAHPDLRGSIFINEAEARGKRGVDDDSNGYVDDVSGWDFAGNDAQVYDDPRVDEHGTHVAGIIAAAAHNGVGVAGVASGVRILPLKFIGSSGGWTAGALEAFAYAKKMGVPIINASWGGYQDDPALKAAIAGSGALVLAAAGNDGVDTDREPFYPASLDLPNVISVGAVDRFGVMPAWSNRGARSVDIAAPGVDILSTIPGGYRSEEGTSMAAPHVAGIAALLAGSPAYAAAGSWQPAAAAKTLLARTTQLPGLRRKVATAGIANAAMTLGVLPAGSLRAAVRGRAATVTWRNPSDTTLRGVDVRLGAGNAIPSPTAGTPVYSGTATTATVTGLRRGQDHTLAVYARDDKGTRSPGVLRILGTSFIKERVTPRTVRVRLVHTATRRGVARATVVLLQRTAAGERVVCRAVTDSAGRASCRRMPGRAWWRFSGSGSYYGAGDVAAR